jgi:hypothetical protein
MEMQQLCTINCYSSADIIESRGPHICHIAPSLRLLVPSSPRVRRQSVQVYHHHSRPGVPLYSVDDVVNPGDDLVRAFPCQLQLW